MERNKYLFLQILDKNHSKKVLKTEVPGNEVALVDVSPPVYVTAQQHLRQTPRAKTIIRDRSLISVSLL